MAQLTIKDDISPVGLPTLTLYDKDGNIKCVRTVKNMTVTEGRSLIAGILCGEALSIPSHIALGTSNTPAAAGQTALLAEVGRVAMGAKDRTANTIVFRATFGEGVGTGALREAGILTASSGGTLLCRVVFDTVTKLATDILTVNWNYVIN